MVLEAKITFIYLILMQQVQEICIWIDKVILCQKTVNLRTFYRKENKYMTLQEFTGKYYLHDSLFDSVTYDIESKSVEMRIDFAYWMQEWYTDDIPETGIITVIFKDVQQFYCPEQVNWEQISIIQTTVEDDSINFSVMNDLTDGYFQIIIKCKSVDVV